jgi:hypothetical protein
MGGKVKVGDATDTGRFTMRSMAIAILGVAAFAAMTGEAAARDGCGNGFYYNGYRCAPIAPRYYAPPPRAYEQRGYRTFNGCPPGYTVQGGACKPYRGY